ncbi:hypothetical protein GCM10011591_21670 [Nocardia camponoti]|uniref:Choline dehydrogenase n=2 Tax=Nocardia camponoti TaxID=1616106 RepID=A0A917V8C3_9NOCA|nr:hypothetical protein GCM10011591_21670 [Nocardia camponoti]
MLEAGQVWARPADIPAHLLDPAHLPLGPESAVVKRYADGVLRGHVVGGSGAINGSAFVRATPADFAEWEAIAGPRWSYAAMLPYYARIERDLDFGTHPGHGSTGPIPVSRTAAPTEFTTSFAAACRAMGLREDPDLNAAQLAATGNWPPADGFDAPATAGRPSHLGPNAERAGDAEGWSPADGLGMPATTARPSHLGPNAARAGNAEDWPPADRLDTSAKAGQARSLDLNAASMVDAGNSTLAHGLDAPASPWPPLPRDLDASRTVGAGSWPPVDGLDPLAAAGRPLHMGPNAARAGDAEDWSPADGLDASPTTGPPLRVDAGRSRHTRATFDAHADHGTPASVPPANRFGPVPLAIENGKRAGPALTHLYPALTRPNLRVYGHTGVTRLILRGRKVIGVEWARGRERGVTYADRVILSAGAIESAALLIRSGIGPENLIRSLGVPVIQPAPVGQFCTDHPEIGVEVPASTTLGDARTHPRARPTNNATKAENAGPTHDSAPILEYLAHLNGIEVRPYTPTTWRPGYHRIGLALMRPTTYDQLTLTSADPATPARIHRNTFTSAADRESLRDAIEWTADLLTTLRTRPTAGLITTQAPEATTPAHAFRIAHDRESATPAADLLGPVGPGSPADPITTPAAGPTAHGRESTTTADDPLGPVSPRPTTDPLTAQATAPTTHDHDPSAQTTDLRATPLAQSDDRSTAKPALTLRETIAALTNLHTSIAPTTASQHLAGSCRMGAEDDPRAVVDEFGRVYGIDGLSIADLSIVPVPLSTGPYATVVTLAARIADQHRM